MPYSGTLTVQTSDGRIQDGGATRSAASLARTSGVGEILLGVFRLLDRAGIAYCVLHGYERFPEGITSDVDCIVDPRHSPSELVALIGREAAGFGAEVLRCSELLIVLGGKERNGDRCFLTLDFATDCQLDAVPFYTGAEVLRTRRPWGAFWVPAARVEFGCYLVRTIMKGRLDEPRLRRLCALFRQDPTGCINEIERHWDARQAAVLVSAVRSGDWSPLRPRLGDLQATLTRRAIARQPLGFVRNKFRRQVARLRRLWHPSGLEVVLLGPDGAGKSSVIHNLESQLIGAFDRATCRGFAPPVRRLLGTDKRVRRTDQPHALPPRSLLASLVRTGYWLLYHTLGYVSLRLALARSTLVLNDRHFLDIFVDTRRYRYGGPAWLLRLVWRLMPKPDLVILLDAPAEVLQRRKQEVSLQESRRQRAAYLALVRSLANGHVVDGARPLRQVADGIGDLILQHLAARTARRHGWRAPAPAATQTTAVRQRA